MAPWSALLSRPTQTPVTSRPSLTLFFLLVGAFLLTLGYHAIEFPLWLSVAIVAAMVLRSLIEVYRLPLPSVYLTSFLAIVLFGLVLVQYGGNILGRDPGTALTAGLIAIKFYELRRPRDVSLIIFSCFFVVMSVLLYSQVLELFIYCLIMMWVLTALLMRVHTGDLYEDYLIRMLGQSGLIYLQALPLGLFLLFAFPRYTGTLSFTMEDAKIGVTDTVAPGSIAKLAKDESTAMYVHFISGNAPGDTDTMYWRGLVLWNYSNGIWTPGNPASEPEVHKPLRAPAESDEVVQEITIKPHNQRWLFALDAPISRPMNAGETSMWSILLNGHIAQLAAGKLNHMERYDITSVPTPSELEVYQSELDDCLQLPTLKNGRIDIAPRVEALADRLHHGLSTTQEQEYVEAVLRYFRDGQFIYSTTPGVQGPDWLPVFLFQTKTGFCEHFASAFAVLMRLQHIPARLVVGYRGADLNPYSGDYVVSQFDAHAWDEVWFPSDEKGVPESSLRGRWIRVDPTSPVAMAGESRSTGSADTQDTLSSQVLRQNSSFYDAYLPPWLRDTFHAMQLRRDQVESDWDDLVLAYDPETQFRIARALGFGQKAPIGLLASCFAAAAICVFVFRKWMLRKEPLPPMESLYAEFCHDMARRGIPRAAWEGPLAYTGRVAEAFPDDKAALQRVGSLVAHARYGPTPADAATHENLKSLLRLLTASEAATASRDRR
jgi:transglutaminase-like putative cysteine protease